MCVCVYNNNNNNGVCRCRARVRFSTALSSGLTTCSVLVENRLSRALRLSGDGVPMGGGVGRMRGGARGGWQGGCGVGEGSEVAV